MSNAYHANEDFVRLIALDTVLNVVDVNDWTLAALWSEETSRPNEAELDTVENDVLVNDCTDAADCKLDTTSPSEADEDTVLNVVLVKLCAEAPEAFVLMNERPEDTVEKIVDVKL